jgi:predicted AAA+ superfamily ATPase
MKKRHISTLVTKSLQLFPVVLLNGARQVGKSTLVVQLVKDGVIEQYVTLDDINVLAACKSDPQGFLQQFKGSVAIDEVQRCPELLMALKHNVDQNRQPGRFLLTGSANLLSYPNICDSLAGRMDIITLETLSLGEINDLPEPSSFLTDILVNMSLPDLLDKWRKDLLKSSIIKNKQDLAKVILLGGFPEIVLKNDSFFTNRWFSSYFSAYTERDVRDLSRFLDVVGFTKVFNLISYRTGQLLNIKNLSVECGLDQRTVSRYLEILGITFQTNTLQPYFSSMKKRLVKTPKVFLNDSGYASFTGGIEQIDALIKSNAFGHLLETWVYAELRKLACLTAGVQMFFYRTHLGKEIDFIMVKGNRTVAIECKAGASIAQQQLLGIKEFQSEVPNTLGLVLYGGSEVLQLSKDIIAVPFAILGLAS